MRLFAGAPDLWRAFKEFWGAGKEARQPPKEVWRASKELWEASKEARGPPTDLWRAFKDLWGSPKEVWGASKEARKRDSVIEQLELADVC